MKLDDDMIAFTAAAESEVLRLLRAWSRIETAVSPRMRRVIEAALLTATIEALLEARPGDGTEDDHDKPAACVPERSAKDHPAGD